MRPDASAAPPRRDQAATPTEARACHHCGATFVPRKPWARFCSAKCRTAHHATADGALRGKVSKVSVMRRGKVSIVLHFDLEDRDRAAALTPGDVIEVLRANGGAKLERIHALGTECDRLRAALERIAEGHEYDPGHYRYEHDELAKIARAALAGTIGDTNADTGADRAPEPASAGRCVFVEDPARAIIMRVELPAPASASPDDLWREAVAWVREQYPEDVFPPDGTSVDSGSARMARLTCDNILRRHAQLAEDARDAVQPKGAR